MCNSSGYLKCLKSSGCLKCNQVVGNKQNQHTGIIYCTRASRFTNSNRSYAFLIDLGVTRRMLPLFKSGHTAGYRINILSQII